MDLTYSEIIEALNKLNIIYDDAPNSRGYLGLLCPFHNDTIMKNAGVDLETGVIHCFACHNSGHVVSLIKEKYDLDYDGAMEFITGRKKEKLDDVSANYNLKNKKKNNYKSKDKLKDKKHNNSLTERIFNPDEYEYTRIRGYTKDFCKEFNIKHCYSGWYADYFIIPIKDKHKNIDTFEARKLCMAEILHSSDIDELDLNMLIDKKQLCIKDFKVYSKLDKSFINNSILLYLLKPKVLYPSGSNVGKTLFNIDNLDFNEDLWIGEGLGTVPKVYNNITKNVTSTFGSEVTAEQIEYLNKFKQRKILIPDNDEASLSEFCALMMEVDNLWVFDVETDDKKSSFVEDLKNANIIEASRYVIREYKLFD